MNDKTLSSFVRELNIKSGKRWQCVIKLPTPNPDYVPAPTSGEDKRTKNQRRATIYKQSSKLLPANIKTKNQAMRELAKWQADFEREKTASELPSARTLVGDYVNSYVDDLEISGNVEKTTIRDYRTSAKRIGEAFPHVTMAELTRTMIQKWENSLTERRLAPRTVIKYHRLLSQVCKHAVNNDELLKNPCDGVKLPKNNKKSPNALTATSYRQLAATFELMQPTPVAIAATIALYTGMRLGEVCGLRWRCYDAAKRTIYVEESIGQGKGGSYSKVPKTKQSRRAIPVSDNLAAALERRRREMIREFESGGYSLNDPTRGDLYVNDTAFSDLYVIGTVDGGFRSPVFISRAWGVMSKSLGLIGTQSRAITFHDLRHTFATQGIANNIDVRTVSSILGHAKTSITLDVYADADPQNKRRAIEHLDSTLNKLDGAKPIAAFTDATPDE